MISEKAKIKVRYSQIEFKHICVVDYLQASGPTTEMGR